MRASLSWDYDREQGILRLVGSRSSFEGTIEPHWYYRDQTDEVPVSSDYTQGMITCSFEQGALELKVIAPGEESNWQTLGGRITNTSKRPLRIELVNLIEQQEFPGFDRVLTNGRDMVSFSALHAEQHDLYADGVVGLTDAAGTKALVIGFTGLEKAFCPISVQRTVHGVSVTAGCELESVVLESGSSFSLPELVIGCGESLSELMGQYAARAAHVLPCSITTPSPTGWCSWYHYYDELTAEDLYRELEVLSANREQIPVSYIQIDDGWNLTSRESKRVWGDWYPGGLFPDGMKRVADDIRRKGFRPGLWLAPFSVDKESRFFSEHPELLVSENGEPKESFGTYGLDLSHPGALQFVEETFSRVFDQWGFEYVKIDFLLHALIRGDRHDPGRTTAQLFRDGLQVIRRVAGDRFILACGSPMGPAIGLADAMRIGYDVSSRWFVPVNQGCWPEGNCNIKASALQHIWRLWMHRTWWVNDADCIIVRDCGSPAEVHNFEHYFPDYAQTPSYGLSPVEALFWSRLIWFTGGVLMVGDSLGQLSDKRFSLLEQVFEGVPGSAGWIDWYADPYVVALRATAVDGSALIGLFNLKDSHVDIQIPAERLNRAFSAVIPVWESLDTQEVLHINEVLGLCIGPHGSCILRDRGVTNENDHIRPIESDRNIRLYDNCRDTLDREC